MDETPLLDESALEEATKAAAAAAAGLTVSPLHNYLATGLDVSLIAFWWCWCEGLVKTILDMNSNASYLCCVDYQT